MKIKFRFKNKLNKSLTSAFVSGKNSKYIYTKTDMQI